MLWSHLDTTQGHTAATSPTHPHIFIFRYCTKLVHCSLIVLTKYCMIHTRTHRHTSYEMGYNNRTIVLCKVYQSIKALSAADESNCLTWTGLLYFGLKLHNVSVSYLQSLWTNWTELRISNTPQLFVLFIIFTPIVTVHSFYTWSL